MTSVVDILEQRGFIAQLSDEGVRDLLANGKTAMYNGFDPSADSLHIGNLVPIMAMAHFQRCGHRVLALVGGATGMVGDPGGKSEERNLLTPQQVKYNASRYREQIARFLDFSGDNAALMLDNHDWIGPITFIEWLRDVGKFFTVNYMMAKDSVKSRLSSEQGISFTEFSYMTMQAYDFLYLFDSHGCTLQCGGNDQWGNITAGIDLIRKARGQSAYGITFPLLETASGEKFGKTAGNAVWLDPERSSPYQFYQYWINTDDRDVERFLKLFTFLALGEIDAIRAAHADAPHKREGQRALAAEVTRMAHGPEGLAKAQKASQVLFGGEILGLTDRDLAEIFADVPATTMPRSALNDGPPLVALLAETNLCKSRGEARKTIKGGGAYINNQRISDIDRKVTPNDLASETMLVLRVGKKNHHVLRFGG